jgi:glycosyltransferase involved in cell wall biosynthesis
VTRPLSIAYVGELPPFPGGAGIRDQRLLSGLVEAGHTIAALAPANRDFAGEAVARANPRLHVTWFTVPETMIEVLRDTPAVWHAQWGLVRAHLPGVLARQRPDVVLLGKEAFVRGVPELTAGQGVPCVALAQSMSFSRWRQELPGTVGGRLVADLRRVDQIICCAQHLAEARRAAGLAAVATVPNAVDTARYRPAARRPELLRELALEPDATVAMHVSNMKPVKRVLDLAASAALALPLRPDLRYVVIGDGPCRASLEQACCECGIADRFRFLPWVDRERMPDLLGLADMVVMPSASEGMSLACLEAMACGRLVIASDIPGAREIIAPDETGLLFRMGDVEDLAAKTVRAAHDPKLRARLGQGARTHVARHHRVEDMVARYAAILADLVARRRACPAG